MIYTNEQLLARIGALNDEINYVLDNGPDISDVPDDAYDEDGLTDLVAANLALLHAVRLRHAMFARVAQGVRERLALENGHDAV